MMLTAPFSSSSSAALSSFLMSGAVVKNNQFPAPALPTFPILVFFFAGSQALKFEMELIVDFSFPLALVLFFSVFLVVINNLIPQTLNS
jgi:hypothetical protein